MKKFLARGIAVVVGLSWSLVVWCPAASASNIKPNTPVITEPGFDGKVVNPQDVHMETAPFSDPNIGDVHVCSTWEIRRGDTNELVWSAECIGGLEKVHIHLGDGTFQGSLAGRRSLRPNAGYVLRARHRDSSGDAATEYSSWAQRIFQTGAQDSVFPLSIDDVVTPIFPTLTRASNGSAYILPGGSSPARIRVESGSSELLLEFKGSTDGTVNIQTNPLTLARHVSVRVRVSAGAAGLNLPEVDLALTDSGGVDRAIYVPAVVLSPNTSAYFWVSDNGSTFTGTAGQTQPDFTEVLRGSPVPWNVLRPGFRVERAASGLQLPVNIAFVPNPGSAPSSPLYYVSELYGQIRVVRRDGSVGTYASGLLNFDPTADFPGSGEQGLTGIAVDPSNGDLIAGLLYDGTPPDGPHYPKVIRLKSTDGGQTASSVQTVLDMNGTVQGQAHQISTVTVGPDGKIYVHMGDGFDTAAAQNLDSFLGKVLRINANGSAPTDNPFYNAANGISARDYVYLSGLRNPFGGAWRLADGLSYFVENGPSVDRLARFARGRNYLWDGSDDSMYNYAIYTWNPASSPVNMAWVESGRFGGSGFPSSLMGRAYVTESGATFAIGPQQIGKRISEFQINTSGQLTGGPISFIEYNGAGAATCVGLAAGPDGLYFTDLFPDLDPNPTAFKANAFRVRYVGVAEFLASNITGRAPLSVQFTDTSSVPNANAWLWTFGDGTTSTARNPTHVYTQGGEFNVRLEVTGPAGKVTTQKNNLVRVDGVSKAVAVLGLNPNPSPAEAAVEDYLRSKGFTVTHYDDQPANRPSAAEIGANFGLVVVPASVDSSQVAGQFRNVNIPMIFWESALLRTDREAVSDSGYIFAGNREITVLNTTHPVTAGLSVGDLTVFSSAQTMSLATGTIAGGANLLATQKGSNLGAIAVAEKGATLLGGYVAPARRVFLFFDDTSFLAATDSAKRVLQQAACWAVGDTPNITTQPSDATVASGSNVTFAMDAAGQTNLTYRWFRNGVQLNDGASAGGGVITGATSKMLTITPARTPDAGQYTCVVSNDCGAAATRPAVLTVSGCDADFNRDGFVNGSDFDAYVAAFRAGNISADFNRDGYVSGDDFDAFVRAFTAGC